MKTKNEPVEKLPESEIAQEAQQKAIDAASSGRGEGVVRKETARFIPSRARRATTRQANTNSDLG